MKNLTVATIVVLLLAGVLSAQTPTAGRIIGTIQDDQGSPLPGVSVAAKSPRLVGTATAVTDSNGVYRLLALPPGTYKLEFTLNGFADVVRDGIALNIEQALILDISMKPTTIEEEVVVLGQAPLIDVKSQARGSVLTQDIFSALPKGRTFDSLVTMMPGVQGEMDLLGGISVDGASGAENVFYTDGTDTSDLNGGTRKQNIVFDFAEEVQFKASGYNAEYGGSVGGVVNVITRSGGNTFRGELVGYFSGTALEGQRRDKLSLDLTNTTRARYYPYSEYVGLDDESRVDLGVSLGGYIIKDRLWFFGAATPAIFQRNRTMNMAIQGRTGINRYERTEHYWNGSLKLSAQPLKNVRAGASFVLSLFNYKGGSDPMTFPSDATYAATAGATTDYNVFGYSYPNYAGSAYVDLTLSNDALLSFRGGYFYNNMNNRLAPLPATPYYAFRQEQPANYAYTSNDMFAEIPAELRHPAGWQNFPRSNVMGLDHRMDSRLSLNTDFTYYFNLAGEHAVKAGAQFMRRTQDVIEKAQLPIVFLGWNLNFVAYGEDYGRGDYGYYAIRGFDAAGAYGEDYVVNMNSWSIYLQDSWTLGHKLTLNFGLRTEAEYLPSYTTDPAYAGQERPVSFSFKDKLSPRFGFAYDVFGDASLKIFGSFGIFQDVMKLTMGANGLGGLAWKSSYYTLDDWDYTQIGVNGNFPGTLLDIVDFRPFLFDCIDPNMKPFTQREISLGLEKRLNEDASVSLRLVNKKVLYAIEDVGVPIENFYYGNPGSEWMHDRFEEARQSGLLQPETPDSPKAKRDYYAANFSLEKRFSHGWQGGVSYTLSRLDGNYSGLASSDEDGRNSPNGERYFDMWHLSYDKALNPIDGALPTDRTHVVKAYGSVALPFGLSIGLVANAYSGTPVSEEWTVDSAGYLPFNRGNMGRTPFIFFANAYLEYQFKLGGRKALSLGLNIDNLFNCRTATRIYTSKYRSNISPGDAALLSGDWEVPADAILDPQFGMPYGFMAPISGRLMVRFVF